MVSEKNITVLSFSVLLVVMIVFGSFIVTELGKNKGLIGYLEYKGIIEDFEISAGGFGHADKCKVITSETTVVASGRTCGNLEIGKLIYKTETDVYIIKEPKHDKS